MHTSNRLLVAATVVSVCAACVSTASAIWTRTAAVAQGSLITGVAPTGRPGQPTVTETCLGSGHQYTLKFVWTAPNPLTSVKGYGIDYSTSGNAGTFTNFVVGVSGSGTLTATSPTLVYTAQTRYYYAVQATAGLWTWGGPFSTSNRFRVTYCA